MPGSFFLIYEIFTRTQNNFFLEIIIMKDYEKD
jgi:hypothetical protein